MALKESIKYASENPNSEYAKELERRIKSGAYNELGKAEGIDLTPFNVAQEPQLSTGGKVGSAIGNLAVGAAQGAGETLQYIGNLVAKPLGKVFGVPQAEIGLPQSAFEPKNTAQKIGKGIERVAEFIVPASKIGTATKALGTVARTAGQVASDVGVTLAQTGSGKEAGKQAVLSTALSSIPVVGKIIGKTSGKGFENISRGLEQINLRLTPTSKAQLAKSENDIVGYITKQKLTGTPEQRFDKILGIVDSFEGKIQDALKGKTYGKNEIINKVTGIPDSYLSQVDNPEVYDALKRDTQKFISFIKKQPGETIDATRVNQFKRNYAKNARNKSGDVVTNESREALSDGLYSLLLADNATLKPINKEYSKALAAKKLLGKAIGRNELGLVGNIISISAGGAVGGALGGPVGTAAGAAIGPVVAKNIAGTSARSRVGAGVQTLADFLKNAKPDSAGNFTIPRSVINSLLQQ